MKTTFTISLRMASQAYDAITDNRKLEEKLTNEYPNVWVLETEDPQEHELLFTEVLEQLVIFGIYEDEYTFTEER